jgi:ribose transport system permease protein
MARLVGVFLMVAALYAALVGLYPAAGSLAYHQVLAERLGFYGVLTIGAGLLIVSGGIDLSIGSLVALGAVCFGLLMDKYKLSPMTAAILVVLGGAAIGLYHGLLITKLRLQPFLVTLCGLFMFRGLARWISQSSVRLPDGQAAETLRSVLVSGNAFGVSNELVLLLVLAAALAVLLHGSVYGRYLYAIGYNEKAAAYAGIATDRYKIVAYVICATLAGLGGVLFLLNVRSAQPTSAGQLLELYAITGAVLGGCNLRGGEGTVPGMLLGAAVLPLLQAICNFSPKIGSDLEWTVIGGALLVGTIANELVKRRTAKE